jgi:hypothetical protein
MTGSSFNWPSWILPEKFLVKPLDKASFFEYTLENVYPVNVFQAIWGEVEIIDEKH